MTLSVVVSLLATPAIGQAVYRAADVSAEYRPLTYSKDGHVQACGIQIIVGLRGGVALSGSINFHAVGKTGLIWKLTGMSVPDRSPLKIAFAGLDIGGIPLSAMLHRMPSDDGFAYTAGVVVSDIEVADAMGRLIAGLSASVVRISFRPAGHDFDHIVELAPIFPTPPAFAEYRRCMASVGRNVGQ